MTPKTIRTFDTYCILHLLIFLTYNLIGRNRLSHFYGYSIDSSIKKVFLLFPRWNLFPREKTDFKARYLTPAKSKTTRTQIWKEVKLTSVTFFAMRGTKCTNKKIVKSQIRDLWWALQKINGKCVTVSNSRRFHTKWNQLNCHKQYGSPSTHLFLYFD